MSSVDSRSSVKGLAAAAHRGAATECSEFDATPNSAQSTVALGLTSELTLYNRVCLCCGTAFFLPPVRFLPFCLNISQKITDFH